jgi:hypothetical protein
MTVPSGPTSDTAIVLHGRPVDLLALTAELQAAGVAASYGVVSGDLLWIFDVADAVIPPTPQAEAVVAAHVPPPRVVDFAGTRTIGARTRTTDAAPHELLRFPLAVQSGYDVVIRVMGVDATSGALKKLKADLTIKRLNAGPVQVGATTVLVTHQDAAAASWALGVAFDGNDGVLSVTGAAGRTIDWLCTGEVGLFTPGGLGA